jgi:hypothetical protein
MEIAMGTWLREARTGAAREFGARHYRKFAAVEVAAVGAGLLARVVVPLFASAAVLALGWLAWQNDVVSVVPWGWIGFVAAAVAVLYVAARLRVFVLTVWLGILGGLGWLIWLALTHALGLSLLVAGATLAAVIVLLFARRWRRYRLRRSVLDWID